MKGFNWVEQLFLFLVKFVYVLLPIQKEKP